MANDVVPAGGQGAVQFDESSEVNAVETRLGVVRTLVEDLVHSGKVPFRQEITVDGQVWTLQVEQANR